MRLETASKSARLKGRTARTILLSVLFSSSLCWAKDTYRLDIVKGPNPADKVSFIVSDAEIVMFSVEHEPVPATSRVSLGEFLLTDKNTASAAKGVLRQVMAEGKSVRNTHYAEPEPTHLSVWINGTKVERNSSVELLLAYFQALGEIVRPHLWNGSKISVAVGPGPIKLYVEKFLRGKKQKQYFEDLQSSGCELFSPEILACRNAKQIFALAVDKKRLATAK